MSEQQTEESGSLREEFHALGDSLKAFFTAAWESEERVRVQNELEAGMRELGNALNQMADEFRSSQAGETLRREVDDFSQRVRSGEVEAKARQEVLKALKALNAELEKAADKFSAPEE